MPNLPLADLIEYDGSIPYQDLKPIVLERLKRQHALRWVLHTSIGDCVLMKLGQLTMDRITLSLADNYPEFVGLVQKMNELRNFEKEGYPLNAEHMNEIVEIARKLSAFQPYHNMACFVKYQCRRCKGTKRVRDPSVDCPDCRDGKVTFEEVPLFETLEDYDAFLSSLRKEEVDKLYPILAELTSAKPPGEAAPLVLTLCKEFGIPFASDLTVENMTAEQGSVFKQTLELEGEAVRKAMKEIPKNA